MTAVLTAINRMGFCEDHVRTSSYVVQPTYHYGSGAQELTGYAATNSVRLRIDSIGRIGAVIDTVLAAGATRVSSIRYESKRASAAQAEALEAAVADARSAAETIARASGGHLGDLLLVTTEAAAPRYVSVAASNISNMPPPPETALSPAEMIITATVVSHWRFVPDL